MSAKVTNVLNTNHPQVGAIARIARKYEFSDACLHEVLGLTKLHIPKMIAEERRQIQKVVALFMFINYNKETLTRKDQTDEKRLNRGVETFFRTLYCKTKFGPNPPSGLPHTDFGVETKFLKVIDISDTRIPKEYMTEWTRIGEAVGFTVELKGTKLWFL